MVDNLGILVKLKKKIECGFILIFDDTSYNVLKKVIAHVKKSDKALEIWTDKEVVDEREYIRKLSAEEMTLIKRLFYLYEFSDKVICIDSNTNFSNMLNYINQGILNEDELVDALFYKIG